MARGGGDGTYEGETDLVGGWERLGSARTGNDELAHPVHAVFSDIKSVGKVRRAKTIRFVRLDRGPSEQNVYRIRYRWRLVNF